MKNKIIVTITSILVMFVMVISSCLDLTEKPEALLTPGNYYKTVAQCNAVYPACMSFLSSTWGNHTGTPGWCAGQGSGSLGYGDGTSTGTWTMHWRVVNNVNPIIGAIKAGGVEGAKADVDDALGQAYFFRAWQYFWLVQFYGKLPWIDEETPDLVANPLTPDSRQEVAFIYDKIEADLTEAFNLMKDYNTSNKARPCKWTAKALLAKVYLTRATAPLNQTANFAKAAATAEEVIQSGKYQLLPIVDIFKATNPNNAEIIHAFQWTADYPSQPGYQGGPGDWDTWGDYSVRTLWADMYPEQPRKHFYVRTIYPRTLRQNNASQPSSTWNWVYYSEHPNDWQRTPYEGKKLWPYLTVDQQWSSAGGNYIYPILRFSEMYLIVAEADNKVNRAPTPRAVEYLNKIIDRANTPIETAWPEMNTYTNKPGTEERANMDWSEDYFDNAVFLERQWELCFEFTAYFDLLRTKKLREWNAETNPSSANNFKETDYLFPIPTYDSGFLGNNPGYVNADKK